MSDGTIKVGIALCGLALGVSLSVSSAGRALEGANDFIPFYVAAGLAGSPEIWNSEPYYQFMDERFGQVGEALVWLRPPFYALLLHPLSLLNYDAAHLAWWLLRMGALAGFLVL